MHLCCAVFCVFVLPCRADDSPTVPETLIRLTVQPAPAPRPALRYVLLPELKEIQPGNPCYNYLKCFMEAQKFFYDKDAFQRREKLLTMPLKELPAQELLSYGGSHLRQADYAARLENPDWQILQKLKAEGINLLVPDLQAMRQLANALKVRFRAEVALGRFDDAIRTAKTIFALSRHVSEHPIYIASLVAIAVAYTGISPLEEMLEQPGCPNLYWALTNLPRPFVPLNKASEGENIWPMAHLGELTDKVPMSEEQIKTICGFLDNALGDGKPIKSGDGARGYLDARTKDESKLNAARRRLIESGLPEERVMRFPPDQVVLLDERREYEERRDELMKLMTLPPHQFEPLFGQLEPQILRNKEKPAIFADFFLPAIQKVHRRQWQLEQRIDMLRVVEAVRMYAAAHNGTLPATLEEISVPLPSDPFTGKPFRYEVNGNTFHVRGTPPEAEKKNAPANIHYEVTIQK
jgi:tetratricopeptide (TPR) repeat protein